MTMAGFAPGDTMDFWCTDKPCWGKNGTSYHMGRNGQVVGEMEHCECSVLLHDVTTCRLLADLRG